MPSFSLLMWWSLRSRLRSLSAASMWVRLHSNSLSASLRFCSTHTLCHCTPHYPTHQHPKHVTLPPGQLLQHLPTHTHTHTHADTHTRRHTQTHTHTNTHTHG